MSIIENHIKIVLPSLFDIMICDLNFHLFILNAHLSWCKYFLLSLFLAGLYIFSVLYLEVLVKLFEGFMSCFTRSFYCLIPVILLPCQFFSILAPMQILMRSLLFLTLSWTFSFHHQDFLSYGPKPFDSLKFALATFLILLDISSQVRLALSCNSQLPSTNFYLKVKSSSPLSCHYLILGFVTSLTFCLCLLKWT